MLKLNLHGALEFLQDYPDMSLRPLKDGVVKLEGTFRFRAHFRCKPSIEDSYELEILISKKFPYELPKVTELKNKIPRDYQHHINPDDTLCVGSPLRVLLKLYKTPTLNTYAEECLVPYLYAISYKMKYGGEFVFGELAHGIVGLVNDYCDILGLTKLQQVVNALNLLGVKKRLANKKECPCGCGKVLGKCEFHHKINDLRKVAPRSFYRQHLMDLKSSK